MFVLLVHKCSIHLHEYPQVVVCSFDTSCGTQPQQVHNEDFCCDISLRILSQKKLWQEIMFCFRISYFLGVKKFKPHSLSRILAYDFFSKIYNKHPCPFYMAVHWTLTFLRVVIWCEFPL